MSETLQSFLDIWKGNKVNIMLGSGNSVEGLLTKVGKNYVVITKGKRKFVIPLNNAEYIELK